MSLGTTELRRQDNNREQNSTSKELIHLTPVTEKDHIHQLQLSFQPVLYLGIVAPDNSVQNTIKGLGFDEWFFV